MTDLDRYLELKGEAERKRREADRAAGMLESAIDELERVSGERSVDAANAQLSRMRSELESLIDDRDAKLKELVDRMDKR